jgi:KDO2-lipid IV(A) lauroyltransferase
LLRILLISLSFLLNLFPFRILCALGDALGWIWFTLFPFRKKVVTDNLRLAFGNSLDADQIERLARANYLHYGRMIFEMLISICWTVEDYQKKIVLTGAENALKVHRAGTGAFFLTCHLGPFELLPGVGLGVGLPVDIVVKHARNKRAEKFLQWYRGRLGANVLIEYGTAKDILRALSRGHFVGFMLDQFMGPPIGLPVKFFGQPAGTAASIALLTEKRDVPILPVYAYREGSKLHVVMEPPVQYPPLSADKETRLFEKTQHLNDVLERIIRERPEQWLWLHRRWKAYLGEPRWKMKHAISLSVISLWLLGALCTTARAETPTGITIPPDAPITVPEFKPSESFVDEDDAATAKKAEAPAPVEEAVPPETPKGKKAKKKTAKGKKEKMTTPPESPAAANTKLVLDPVSSERIPFDIGERVQMQLSWIGLSAGTATMEVRKGPEMYGRPTFEFWGSVVSSKLVDAIYHVENTVETFVDARGLIPYKFVLHMFETAQKKETRVMFDHPNKRTQYWSQRISKKWGDETVSRIDELVPAAKDMWSGLYYARTLNYTLNEKQTFTIYENGKNWQVELLPVANELLNTKVGAFQCWKILVIVKLNNVLRPTGDIFMWLSDDSKRYIVKFDAKIKIGSLLGNIISIRDHQ